MNLIGDPSLYSVVSVISTWMPRIQDLALLGPVDVASLRMKRSLPAFEPRLSHAERVRRSATEHSASSCKRQTDSIIRGHYITVVLPANNSCEFLYAP